MSDAYERLKVKIDSVRRRWRIKAFLRGLALTLCIAFVAFYVALFWGRQFGFSAGWLILLRAMLAVVLATSSTALMLLPLLRRVSPSQVARFVEERYPELEQRLTTAIEFGSPSGQRQKFSDQIIDRLIEDALAKTSRIDLTSLIRGKELGLLALASALIIGISTLPLFWGPEIIRYGAFKLLALGSEASPLKLLRIDVSPGNAEIPKGSDQKIVARAIGFAPESVLLYVRDKGDQSWRSERMQPENDGNGHVYTLFNLEASKEYYVVAESISSPQYTLTVSDLPRVTEVKARYRYPEYTGLEPQTQEDGNLSALKGTEVELEATLNRSVRRARLKFNDGKAVDLALQGNTAKGKISILKNSTYVIELTAENGKTYIGSPEYHIEALEDQPPVVTITKPGRDRRATRLEEVFTQAKAEDDNGIGQLELCYSINGGPEEKATLFSNRGHRPTKSITGAYTFFLEEFKVSPGDIISYYAKATDLRRPNPNVSKSDIYFLEIQRTDKEFYQMQAMPGQGEGNSMQELSRRQKEIIAATWKLVRDKGRFESKEFDESARSLALIQGRLRSEAANLANAVRQRTALNPNSDFQQLAAYLEQASKEMEKAEKLLSQKELQPAISPEQAALQQLLKAESLFREIQIAYSNSSQGDGELLQDLEELFELEIDKLKNQYETLAQQAGRKREEQLDEALRRLRELAQRQQQLSQMQMRQPQISGGSSLQGQSQLAQELEGLKRHLERLARERPEPQLAEASRQLGRALDQMRKSLEQMRGGNSQAAAASSARAAQQLSDLEQRLRSSYRQRWSDSVRQARQDMERLLNQQRGIEGEVRKLAAKERSQGQTEAQQRKAEQLIGDKYDLAAQLENLQKEIDRLARDDQSGQQAASDKLRETSEGLRRSRTSDKIEQNNQLIARGMYGLAEEREKEITSDLERAVRQLGEAEKQLSASSEDKLAEALNDARSLIDSLRSMMQRLQAAQSAARSQQQANQQSAAAGSQPGESQQAQGRQGQPRQAQNRSQQASARARSGQMGQPSSQPSGSELTVPDAGAAPAGGPYVATDASRGPLSDSELRQLRRELAERIREASELAGKLRDPAFSRQIEQILSAMRQLDARMQQNLQVIDMLAEQIIQPLQQLELQISRHLGVTQARDKFHTADEDSVPAEYRRLVEEYYKRLAEGSVR